MTPDEVVATQSKRFEASLALYETLRSGALTGAQRHALQCRHRFINGRHPFICAKCWSYMPVCVCAAVPTPFALPAGVEVVVWVHHKEWGLSSNTGSLLGLALEPCTLLMKGLSEHDARLAALLEDPEVTPVLLWPARNRTDDVATSLPELRQLLAAQAVAVAAASQPLAGSKDRSIKEVPQSKRVVLIAVDSTWSSAAKMVSKFPRTVARLGLSESELFWEDEKDSKDAGKGSSGEDDDAKSNSMALEPPEATAASEVEMRPQLRKSLLAPLRKRRDGGAGDVCTAEAVVAALRGLGLGDGDCRNTLRVVKQKVDLTARYRGKVAYLKE
jgi:DTW domain-containing protein YfiP